MKQRLLIGSMAIAILGLAYPQVKGAHAQMNDTKDSPVYSGVLVKDRENGRVYRITVKDGQIVAEKTSRNVVEAK